MRLNIDQGVMLFAGCLILITVLLGYLHSAYWLWLTAFIGLNLVQASITGFCPMAKLLKRVGFVSGSAFK